MDPKFFLRNLAVLQQTFIISDQRTQTLVKWILSKLLLAVCPQLSPPVLPEPQFPLLPLSSSASSDDVILRSLIAVQQTIISFGQQNQTLVKWISSELLPVVCPQLSPLVILEPQFPLLPLSSGGPSDDVILRSIKTIHHTSISFCKQTHALIK